METLMDLETEIARLEQELLDGKERLATLRRSRPATEVQDATLRTTDGSTVSLSELFGDRQELILVHNMGVGCSYCTMWADGFNSLLPHLENRAAFAVESPNDPTTMRAFAEGRGWRFRMVSSQGSTLRSEAGFVDEDGDAIPGVSVFVRREGRIYQTNKAVFGPGDDFCATWHLFDLLPAGPEGWEPKFRY